MIGKNLLVYGNGYTVYKPVHVAPKNSKIYDKVTTTIWVSYLLHTDEHTVVVIKKIEELSYIYKNQR